MAERPSVRAIGRCERTAAKPALSAPALDSTSVGAIIILAMISAVIIIPVTDRSVP
jgi:hypothetical protein